MRFLFFIIIATFFFLEIDAHHQCKRCPKDHCCKNVVCPSLLPTGDLSLPADLKAAQILIIGRLWNTTYPKLTCKGNDLKKAVLKMAESDVDRWRITALSTSIAFWSVAQYYKSNINFCSYSKSINSTVLSETAPACDLIFSALDGFAEMVADRMKLIVSTGVKITNCGCIKSNPMAPNCYKNGTVYMGKELWDLKGWDYPCFYERAVRRLMRSCDKLDKLMAVMATSSISDASYKFVVNYDQKALMEMFYLQTMPKLDCCCCEDFVKAIKDIELVGVNAALDAAQKSKLLYPQCQ